MARATSIGFWPSVDGQLLPIPINLDTINRLYGFELDSAGMEKFLASVAEKRDRCALRKTWC